MEDLEKILAHAKKLLDDDARRELADDVRIRAQQLDIDEFEERDEKLRAADEIVKLCTTPDSDTPAQGQYVPRAVTSDEISKVYGYDMAFEIVELHKQSINPLFETLGEELSDKQRDRGLEVLTAAFEEFSGQGAKKPNTLAKDLIAAIHEWIGDEPEEEVFIYDEEQYRRDVEDCRCAIADHLLIVINNLKPKPRGVNAEAIKETDNRAIGNRGHDDGGAPDYTAHGGDRVHVARRRTAFDRRKSGNAHLDGTKGIKGDIEKALEAEARHNRRMDSLWRKWFDRARANGYFDEVVGLGPSNVKPKRIVKKRLMQYERNVVKAKREAAWKRELAKREKEALADKIRALKGHSRFRSTRRSDDDWEMMARADDALPEEKRNAVQENEWTEQAMEREAEERAKAEYTDRKDHKKLAVTKWERQRQAAERAVAEAEKAANEAEDVRPSALFVGRYDSEDDDFEVESD